jgi:hypothetical protein
MTLAKQGILISHAIALTVMLLLAMVWKTPSSQKVPLRLEGKTSVQPLLYNSALFETVIIENPV